jgi:asparagine synthase (glutamine-hydrolysing)
MCGIAGLVLRNGETVSTILLDRFADILAHRGPDGTGQWLDGSVGLMQTRLAIIDLDTGDQPLHGPADTHLVANGEIYNYVELKDALGDQDWKTRSDCEPPLVLYNSHGAAYPEHLRGMFAIALHDRASGKVTLTRDPFGIKPLYYAETDAGIAFASEPQTLLAAGIAPEVDPKKRAELLQLQFTTGAGTIFKGINRVLPGETLTVNDGRISGRERVVAQPDPETFYKTEKEAIAAFDTAFADAVAVHQRSDVPYGLFLSGGIDSSAVLAMMRRLNDRPVRCFTAYFPGTAARDEREHARRVADAAGAEMEEVPFDEEDFWSLLPAGN